MLSSVRSLVGLAIVLFGLALFMFGNAWAPAVPGLLPDTELGHWLELFVPFLPIALVGIGAVIRRR